MLAVPLLRREADPRRARANQSERLLHFQGTTLQLLKRLGRRFFDQVRGRRAGLVAVALVIGVAAGLGAVGFRYLILWCTILATGRPDYALMEVSLPARVSACGSFPWPEGCCMAR
jgi:hypothetical protein